MLHYFQHYPSRDSLRQFRYNTYDRAPLNTIPHNQITRFYRALQNLELEMANPDNEVRFMLQPGNVLFVDNWRVTHGRTAFKGHRIMSGCYVTRGNWRSRARAHGLLPWVLLFVNSSNRFYSDTNLEENYTIYNTHEICGIALDVTDITW